MFLNKPLLSIIKRVEDQIYFFVHGNFFGRGFLRRRALCIIDSMRSSTKKTRVSYNTITVRSIDFD